MSVSITIQDNDIFVHNNFRPIIKLKRQIKGTEVFVEINHIYDVYDPITGQNKSNGSTNQPNHKYDL